jgi:hypothetical protein
MLVGENPSALLRDRSDRREANYTLFVEDLHNAVGGLDLQSRS